MKLELNLNPLGRDGTVFVSSSSTSLESLLPVQLPEDDYKEYVNTFFPKRRPAKGFHTSRKHYYDLAVYLVQFSSFVGALQVHLKDLALDMLEYDEKVLIDSAASRFARALFSASNEGLQSGLVKDYLEGLRGKHVIVKTKSGFDIKFSGLPASSRGGGTCITNPTSFSASFPESRTGYRYQQFQQTNAFDKAFFKMLRSVCQLLNTELVGSAASIETSANRKVNSLPLDYDLEALVRKLNAEAKKFIPGIDLFGEVKVPKADPELLAGLKKYVRILVVHEAERSSVDQMSRENPPRPLTAETSTLNEHAVIFNAVLGISFSLSLPRSFAEFITQTPPNKEVPLVPLNTWVTIWTSALMNPPKKKSGERVFINQAPRYVLSASQSQVLAERRKALGFFTEPGRINEDGIFTSNTGRFNWCPASTELALDNAKNYEALMEEALALSYNAGTPLNASQVGETSKVFGLASPEYREKIRDIKAKINSYAGSLQTYSWDYNVILTSSSSDPERLVSYNLAGAAQPNELSVADYLRKPFVESMFILFPYTSVVDDGGNRAASVTEATFGKGGSVNSMLKTTLFVGIYKLYQYLLAEKKVPVLQDLVLAAAKDLGISKITESPYEIDLYRAVMDDEFSVKPEYNKVDSPDHIEAQARAMYSILNAALRDSSGAPGTNLARITLQNGTDIKDDDHYFNPEFFTLGEFRRVYNYLGGRVFQRLCEHVMKVPRRVLLVLNPDNPFKLPDFQILVKEIMPGIIILGKYVHQSESIIQRAHALEEANKRNTGINPEDIKVPGSKEGFQIFPHQLKVHQYLRNHPRYAILDVAPGGGKTLTLLTDAADLVGRGLIKTPPFIFAPNGLVKNWVEDMHKVSEGRWNVIPITTSVYRSWGDERLTKLIQTAPRNTIVIMSTSVLRLDKYPVVIGNHVEQVSAVLEFARKFGAEYIALDESHRAKGASTAVHKAMKQLMTSSSVKYIRLATGTLIKDKLTDVVGQASLFNSQIFRTAEEYEAENSERLGSYTVMTWKKDTPKRAREQLSKHCAVITAKKKEWAFMLPRPLETFIPVRLEKPDTEGGTAHQLMYEAILAKTLEEIRQDPEVMRLLQGRDEDTDTDDDDDEDQEKSPASEKGQLPVDNDLDDATLAELEAKLEPYLARLEQLLTDPLGDPFGEVYFKGMSKDNYVSNKVLKIIERIKLNFTEFPWVRGKKYALKDLADFNGQRYVLMGPPGKKLTLDDYNTLYESHVAPDKDPRWKPEPYGKVIVFCRYTRSVNAVYRALPPELKKLAVKFHGEVKNKWDGFETFRKSPFSMEKGIQILIANEQAITEGHNLQSASRIIRCESPWSPGELDQSASRIFRPDPSKEFSRENVYLDWVLCNGTLEVAKMGRLISKMLVKAQFDEAGNALYDPIAELQLPMIRMSLETIASVPVLGDIMEYIDAYKTLVHIQSSEFEEMRQSGPSSMLSVPPTPMFKDSAILDQVPYVPNLEIPDRHNFGLLRLSEYLQDTDDPEVMAILKDRNRLIGSYVHTEFGNGVITRVGLSRALKGPGITPEEAEAARRITRIDVKLASGDEYSAAPSMIYLATNITKDNVTSFSPTTKQATKRDKVIAERAKKAEEKREAREAQRARREAEREAQRARREAERAKREAERAKAQPSSTVRRGRDREIEESPNLNVELYPVVYNGFLALEGTPEDPTELDLRQYGFKEFGDYAYALIKDYQSFTALLDWLESKFSLSPQTIRRLDKLHDSFQSGRGRKFAVELAPVSEFKNFYLLRHKLSGKDDLGRPELKVYPVIINQALILNIDIATNPAIRRYLNKVIPGTRNLKFQEASGLYIKFFNKRSDLVRSVKDLRAEGLVITNFDELKQELADLKTAQNSK